MIRERAQNLRRMCRDFRVDLYLRPPHIASYKLLDYHLIDRIVRTAYRCVAFSSRDPSLCGLISVGTLRLSRARRDRCDRCDRLPAPWLRPVQQRRRRLRRRHPCHSLLAAERICERIWERICELGRGIAYDMPALIVRGIQLYGLRHAQHCKVALLWCWSRQSARAQDKRTSAAPALLFELFIALTHTGCADARCVRMCPSWATRCALLAAAVLSLSTGPDRTREIVPARERPAVAGKESNILRAQA